MTDNPSDFYRKYVLGLRNPDGSYETIDVTTHGGYVLSRSIHGETPDMIIEDDEYACDTVYTVESVIFDGRVIYPKRMYEPVTEWTPAGESRKHADPFALGGTPADRTPITAIYTPQPSDDDLYGKAVRDESGEPIATAQAPARTDRVNQDLEWFRQVNAGMKKLGLDGDEPLPPEPAKATGGLVSPGTYGVVGERTSDA